MASRPNFQFFPLIGWEAFPTVNRPRKGNEKCCLMCYFDGFLSQRGKFKHHAIDINGTIGTPCVAVTSGIGWQWGKRPENTDGTYTHWDSGGWHYYLLGDDGVIYYYAHLDKQPVVNVGERVRAGQYIGPLGRSGNAGTTCPHNHFAMYATNLGAGKRTEADIKKAVKGKPINPYPFLNATRKAATGKRPIGPGEVVGGGGRTGIAIGSAAAIGGAAVGGFLLLRFLKKRKAQRSGRLDGYDGYEGSSILMAPGQPFSKTNTGRWMDPMPDFFERTE